MSIFDDIKAKASGLLDGHGDKLAEGREKAGELGEQIKGVVQKAKDALGGENDGAS
jgi:hypothetical protein